MSKQPTQHEVDQAVALMFDAFDAAFMADGGRYSVGDYNRSSDDVDISVSNVARALLAAGWTPPRPPPETP